MKKAIDTQVDKVVDTWKQIEFGQADKTHPAHRAFIVGLCTLAIALCAGYFYTLLFATTLLVFFSVSYKPWRERIERICQHVFDDPPKNDLEKRFKVLERVVGYYVTGPNFTLPH